MWRQTFGTLLHVSHAASQEHNNIIIRTVDADVLVLAVMVAEKVS